MKIIPFLFIIFLLAIQTSCNNSCTEISDSYENENRRTEKYYPNCDDKSTYSVTNYFSNNEIESTGFYKKNKKHGEFKRWNDKGIKIEHWFMENDEPVGTTICRFDNGALKRRIQYYKESIFIDIEEWDEEGEDYIYGKSINGERTGLWKRSNQKDRFVYTFENDSLNGYTYEYIVDSNKIIHVIGEYLNDKESGIWKWYDSDSLLYDIAKYQNGKLINFLPVDRIEKLKK